MKYFIKMDIFYYVCYLKIIREKFLIGPILKNCDLVY